jgi:putative acetyltransferase
VDPAPRSVIIRPETRADGAEISRVVAAAFDGPTVAALVDQVRASPGFLPGLSLVAELDGRVVGHVLVSHADLRLPGGRARPVAMLSPLAVDPDHQRNGIGAALVRAVVHAAEDLGEPLILLQGDPRYYGRFGFEPSAGHGITMSLPDWAPPEAAQVLRLSNDDPSLRGELEEPPGFGGHDT